MAYIVLDLETTTSESFKRKANPFDPRNRVIVVAWKRQGGEVKTTYGNPASFDELRLDLLQSNVIIGHNIKFDLLHMLQNKEMFELLTYLFSEGVRVFDTQLAEYLITGQQTTYASLNDVATKYGGTLKNDVIKEMWQAGIDTPDIPEDILLEYAKHDIINTEIVALAQITKIKELKMGYLTRVQNSALLATTFMEYHGLKVNKGLAEEALTEIEREVKEIDQQLLHTVNMLAKVPHDVDINLSSTQQLSACLFGGEIKYKKRLPIKDEAGNIMYIKTGKNKGDIKTKIEECTHIAPGLVPPEGITTLSKTGYYQTGIDVLERIAKSKYPEARYIASTLIYRRDLTKQASTYFQPLLELTTPWTGCVHGQLNHVATSTGRLSSKNPNMQNIPRRSK